MYIYIYVHIYPYSLLTPTASRVAVLKMPPELCTASTHLLASVILGQWKTKWKLLYSLLGLYWDNGKDGTTIFGFRIWGLGFRVSSDLPSRTHVDIGLQAKVCPMAPRQ